MSESNLKKKVFKSLVVLTLYVLMWSAIFMIIEQTGEPNAVVSDRMLEEVKSNISRLLEANISEEHFIALVSKISVAVKIQETPDWSYWQTTDFVIQSLTTIGKNFYFTRLANSNVAVYVLFCFGYNLFLYFCFVCVHRFWRHDTSNHNRTNGFHSVCSDWLTPHHGNPQINR